ncbi:hypothetical protein GGS24DRAFT_499994 [Hypoxylon argillaceum]|nr:hypothetical protein GGS24DRAFT_499994 [Hypoxylon argillaceum]KAI1156221.1 hypothetical protein F4825DRAFT_446703 [Nemania diffusa]
MQYANLFLGLLWAAGACARYAPYAVPETQADNHDASIDETSSAPISRYCPQSPSSHWQSARDGNNRRDTNLPRANPYSNNTQYPINCHLHNWPSASVDSIKQAYSWFYQLWAPLEADAQQCRRIACFGSSAVWLCADTLGYQSVNSVKIADEMNDLLDGNTGCLDKGNKNMVQGQKFTSAGWSVLVRGGEDCSADVPEKPIFY